MSFNNLSSFEIGSIVIGISAFIIVCYGIRLLFLIVNTNCKIENLYRQRDKEIEEETTSPGITTGIAEAKKKYITEKYQKMIDPLVRKKGYVFDILPLIPKK
jgi:hypothetical protein